MSDRFEHARLPYDHLAVVAHNNRELLLVNYGDQLPTFSETRLRQEVFEREPVDVVTICLEEAALIVNSTTALQLGREFTDLKRADEVRDQSRIGILAGALERRRMATQLVHAANSTYVREYTFEVTNPDESDTHRKLDIAARDALISRTSQFVGHPALTTVIALKELRFQGLPEAVRQEAELTLRVMYDQAGVAQHARDTRAA